MSADKKFIVWDWNGTLLDDADAVVACVNIVLERAGCAPKTADEMRAIHPRKIHDIYRAAGVPEEKLSQFMEEERQIFHNTYEPLADKAPLRQGAAALLKNLKANNVTNLIVSNHIIPEIARLLASHNIAEYFEEVLAYPSRDMQFKNMTKGEKLHAYIKEKGLNASNAVIVGDTLEEIEIARELGMGSISITNGMISEKRLRELKPDHVIHALDEMTPILQERGFIA